MTVFNLNEYLEARRLLVEKALEEALPENHDLAGTVVSAMRYSLLDGGKRLRPVLCLAGAEAVGGRAEQALPAAVALEMIHSYSLIHDDLPAMDDDDLRRGRPSNHMVFGQAQALLAGDGLLTLAFQVLGQAGFQADVRPERYLRVISYIAAAAGYEGMVGGQSMDIASEGKSVGLAEIDFIHQNKTAALIRASLVSGAVLGGGDDGRIALLEDFGRLVGVAFQIMDDILDIEGDTIIMGKPAGSDLAKGKATYPGVVGLENARRRAIGLLDQAVDLIGGWGIEAQPLRAIAEYLRDRKK